MAADSFDRVGMKPALQFRLHQQLTLTPQLQQAIRLLQLSQLELEVELRQIAESNPLLEFAEDSEDAETADDDVEEYANPAVADGSSNIDGDNEREDASEWADGGANAETPIDFSRSSSGNNSSGARTDEDFEPQNAAPETLQQHLLWQLNMAPFNPRQHAIATVLIDALNPAGYLADGVESVLAALPAELKASVAEIDAVRRCLQGFDPAGVGARTLFSLALAAELGIADLLADGLRDAAEDGDRSTLAEEVARLGAEHRVERVQP